VLYCYYISIYIFAVNYGLNKKDDLEELLNKIDLKYEQNKNEI